MNFFLLNILLAIVWAALSGQVAPQNLIGGFVLGYFLLWVVRGALGCNNYVTKVSQVIRFAFFFASELVQANVRVAWEVLTPGHGMRPAIVAVPLDLDRDIEILLLANMITLTPGTLSLDVSTDKRVLYIHAMYVDNVDDFRREIKQGYEKRVEELFA